MSLESELYIAKQHNLPSSGRARIATFAQVIVNGSGEMVLDGDTIEDTLSELTDDLIVPKATTPVSLVANDNRNVYTNEGATAKIVFNLPTAAAGYRFTFIVKDADGMQVVAASGDTIRIAEAVSAAGGNADTTTIGSTLTLVSINATEWMATESLGIWTLT
jgi:hypothetical protein